MLLYYTQRVLVLIITLALVSACSNTATEQENLASLVEVAKVWSAKGRISIVNEQDNWYAKFNWDQQYDDFQISFTGPLGATELQISQVKKQTILETPSGKKQGNNLEQLIYQEVGWKFPVSSLKYWLQGKANPDMLADIHYNDQKQIKEIIQAGWRIEYSKRMLIKYPSGKQILLPKKIVAIGKNMKIKLIITQWQIGKL